MTEHAGLDRSCPRGSADFHYQGIQDDILYLILAENWKDEALLEREKKSLRRDFEVKNRG
jgi:hypothetical protein